jgi:hypothetical protein
LSFNLSTQSTLNLDFGKDYDAKHTQFVELNNTTVNPIKVSNVIVSDASSYWVNLFADDKATCRAASYSETIKDFIIPAKTSCKIGVGFSPIDNANAGDSLVGTITLKTLINGVATDKVINVTGLARGRLVKGCHSAICQLKGSLPPINGKLLGLPQRYVAAKFWYGSLLNPRLQKNTASVGNLVVFAQNSMNITGHVGVVIQTLPVITMLSMNDVKDQNGVKLRKWSVRPVDGYPNQAVTWSPLITGFNRTDATKHYGFIDWKSSLY